MKVRVQETGNVMSADERHLDVLSDWSTESCHGPRDALGEWLFL